ncbi:MAG: DUF167 domain-containing protein [Chloroflexi bacterium]|nr:DUF167 domain-containing protein [Chloroflexota bacterium]
MPTFTIEVHVQPKASRNRIVVAEGAIKVYVTSVPEKGRANKAVIEEMARHLGVPKRAVSIISGERSRKKLVAVEGPSKAEALRKLT